MLSRGLRSSGAINRPMPTKKAGRVAMKKQSYFLIEMQDNVLKSSLAKFI